MRISDWSSDVCSSDLRSGPRGLHLLSRTNHSSARRHRLEDFVAQIEVVEESRGCMHAGNPEDGVAEGGVYFHDQLTRSMCLRDLGGDVESEKGDRNPHRSEEHTSELQSLMRISYAVFCWKKK